MEQKEILEAIVNELLDEVSLGLCFEIHRACKLGTFLLDEMDTESHRLYEIVNDKGVDVFGQIPTAKKQYDCICPNCYRNMAASRFAPHLEKCMGMGGNVLRVASRRNASVRKKCSDIESDDNSRDNDWTYQTGRKVKKAKKDKRQATPKKSKGPVKQISGKGSNSGVIASDSVSSIDLYDTMASDERRSLLHRTYDVISESSKKASTRSVDYPKLREGQRKRVCDLLEADLSYDTETSLDDDLMGHRSVRQSINDDIFTPSSSETGSPTKNSTMVKKKKKEKKKKKKKKTHFSRDRLIKPVNQDYDDLEAD